VHHFLCHVTVHVNTFFLAMSYTANMMVRAPRESPFPRHNTAPPTLTLTTTRVVFKWASVKRGGIRGGFEWRWHQSVGSQATEEKKKKKKKFAYLSGNHERWANKMDGSYEIRVIQIWEICSRYVAVRPLVCGVCVASALTELQPKVDFGQRIAPPI
jgi:hypothetical protein